MTWKSGAAHGRECQSNAVHLAKRLRACQSTATRERCRIPLQLGTGLKRLPDTVSGAESMADCKEHEARGARCAQSNWRYLLLCDCHCAVLIGSHRDDPVDALNVCFKAAQWASSLTKRFRDSAKEQILS